MIDVKIIFISYRFKIFKKKVNRKCVLCPVIMFCNIQIMGFFYEIKDHLTALFCILLDWCTVISNEKLCTSYRKIALLQLFFHRRVR